MSLTSSPGEVRRQADLRGRGHRRGGERRPRQVREDLRGRVQPGQAGDAYQVQGLARLTLVRLLRGEGPSQGLIKLLSNLNGSYRNAGCWKRRDITLEIW